MNLLRSLKSLHLWIILSWASVSLLAYFGNLNPFPLGLVSSLVVLAGMSALSFLLLRLLQSRPFSFRLLHSLLIGITAFIVVSSWYYFDYFQQLYSYEILQMGGDLLAGRNALNLNAHKQESIQYLGIVLLLLVPIWFIQCKPQTGKAGLLTLSSICILGLLLSEQSYQHYKERGVNWLHPGNIHPLHAFFSSPSRSKAIKPSETAAFQQTKSRSQTSPDEQNKKATPYNVIVLLLESFRADMVGLYQGKQNTKLTPNFDALTEHGAIGKMHFSNTTHTVSAEVNLWCSTYDLKGPIKLTYHDNKAYNFTCLPEMLSGRGYDTYYFHGNTGRFYNRNNFLPKLGFEQLFFHKDEDDPLLKGDKIGWGVDDISMFEIVWSQLQQQNTSGKPFFAHFTSLSNHYPFSIKNVDPDFNKPFPESDKKNTTYQNYQNMIGYTDFALGRFWDKFIQSELANNTIVVITSDHGIWEFGEQALSLSEKNERFFRAPLFIYHPRQKLADISQLSSHIDVAPTLISMLGLSTTDSMLGSDLFKPTTTDNWVASRKGSEVIYRTSQQVCYVDQDQCADKQQDCKLGVGELHLFTTPEDAYVCTSIESDPLIARIHSSPKPALDEYQRIRNYVSYVNKTLISK